MRNGLTVLASLVAASLVATPAVIGATKALATSDRTEAVAQVVAVAPVEVASIQAVPAAVVPLPCKKVRVIYSGYADAPAACTTAR